METNTDYLPKGEQPSGENEIKEISVYAKILFFLTVIPYEFLFEWAKYARVRGYYCTGDCLFDFHALMYFIPGFLLGASPLSRRWKVAGVVMMLLLRLQESFLFSLHHFGFSDSIYSRLFYFIESSIVLYGVLFGLLFYYLFKKVELNILEVKLYRSLIFGVVCIFAFIQAILLFQCASNTLQAKSVFKNNLEICRTAKKEQVDCYRNLSMMPYECDSEFGDNKAYCYDAIAIEYHALELCKNGKGITPSCTDLVMNEIERRDFPEWINPGARRFDYKNFSARCEVLSFDSRLLNECYVSYVNHLPSHTKKEINNNISICEKIKGSLENESLCIASIAEKVSQSSSLLSETEYLQLCDKIPNIIPGEGLRMDCMRRILNR